VRWLEVCSHYKLERQALWETRRWSRHRPIESASADSAMPRDVGLDRRWIVWEERREWEEWKTKALPVGICLIEAELVRFSNDMLLHLEPT
jgi:hypothetical protein